MHILLVWFLTLQTSFFAYIYTVVDCINHWNSAKIHKYFNQIYKNCNLGYQISKLFKSFAKDLKFDTMTAHLCLATVSYVRNWVGHHASCQEGGRCSQVQIRLPTLALKPRCHQKSKTGVPVTPKTDSCLTKKLF